jgi:hypothetical protein
MSILCYISHENEMTKDFSEEDKIRILLWCDRHCCLCDKTCGTDIVIHHIEPEGTDINNAIPLCLECHNKIASYDPKHPWGTKYKVKEIKARREQIYEKYTRHLVPPIHFEITQRIRNIANLKRSIPAVSFNLTHLGDSLPVRLKVEARTLLREKSLGLLKSGSGYYSGETLWTLNPRTTIFGWFSVPKECGDSSETLRIEVRVTIIDQYNREHKLLPVSYAYVRKDNSWFLEPRAFTNG